jgi:hypothetical protein
LRAAISARRRPEAKVSSKIARSRIAIEVAGGPWSVSAAASRLAVMVAVARPQEGCDEGRVRAQGFEAEGVGVGGELPPAGVVGPAGVLGGGAGDEARSVVMARATVGEAEGGTSITLEGLRSG